MYLEGYFKLIENIYLSRVFYDFEFFFFDRSKRREKL